MATSGASGSGEPDMVLISELLETMARHPPAIAARKLLVEHYVAVGWLDAAKENLAELKKSHPQDSDVVRLSAIVEKPSEPAHEAVRNSTKQSCKAPKPLRKPVKQTRQPPPPKLNGDLEGARKELAEGYTSLRLKANAILTNLKYLAALQKRNGLPQSDNTARIQRIVDGRKPDVGQGPPGSIRGVARAVCANSEKALDIIIADLEETMNWIRSPHGKPSGADNDTVRDALIKRSQALKDTLPETLRIHCEMGLLHMEHENLERNYVNDETMYGDLVKDIPREDFYVTEDNYAWDLTELVQAITVNGGVMRNPLSKVIFTPKDIRGILAHPHGKSLAALQVEQHEMSQGVRLETILQLENLAKVMLDDNSQDQLPTRLAIDEFMAYVARLPELEQKAINGLRCPAKDSHTGQAYDLSIGEAVRDAKANRICSHKTGDFIRQAAAFLRQHGGTVRDSDKCVVM
ncbi:hypothetical protein P280DRAFT_320250 [Massarina eburnea CBS 473.64]|uniref:Uncharacterized protein n=1 Tax=Massarina eburnea CBS 473.64 TaxID=1395130 RepID=A0A6A6RY54_9PLEO|nr:hypothetical protein P280DRAFT_320250 [Massarina eburnea CBS 473.64]